MTVTYTLEVSQARFWGFPKLLARWRGSIYRLMYREMCVFLAAYYLVAFCYRYVAPSNMQRHFERFAIYCKDFTAVVPITFLMGFYVSFVVGRWWQQYMSIPWPDRLAMEISAYVQGVDERGRLIRRALVRYLNLLAVLTFQSTSTVIKKRFPTVDHLVDAGLLTADERSDLEAISTPHGIWWIPAQWFAQLAMIARKEGRIFDDLHLKTLIDDLMVYRGQCGQIWSYDWISVPLVYTQVVTIAVYSFFGSCLFGRQYLLQNSEADNSLGVDYYLPIFTIFQFLFYVGWLKVAESMICPFGEDDDDFDMNWLVDRNVQVSYVIVDQMHRKSPKLSRDIFWDNLEPEMPYTQAAANYKREPFFGSTTAMNISTREAEWDIPSDQMPAISEECDPSEKLSPARKKLGRSSFRGARDLEKGSVIELSEEDEGDEADKEICLDEEETDIDDDASRQFEVKEREKRGLLGLALGYSRQALGSKQSLSSHNSKSTTTRWNRSPNVSRKNSVPVGNSDQNFEGVLRSSSSIDSISIIVENGSNRLGLEKLIMNTEGNLPVTSSSSFKVDVPSVVMEESEHDESCNDGSLNGRKELSKTKRITKRSDSKSNPKSLMGDTNDANMLLSQSTNKTNDSGIIMVQKSFSTGSNISDESGERSLGCDSRTHLINSSESEDKSNSETIR